MLRLDVFMNPPLMNWLCAPLHGDEEASPLDVCLHMALVGVGEDSFSARFPLSS